ncbi:hypothetical protein J2Z83_002689 [Virgibacillus natechei]|uniref:Transposase n=1 Tax=Virgibacillus natechei TaxID=1216297 RepID=A0ABS4II68_9BACI|nr:hypothetical protein [Virgibacillus natechei]MBP1970568.1 hypothetical protein [Virgibacillus natechei]UZD14032.1 hypothetical protein OLD84_05810 [Virgibacillus natechei]
MINKGDENYFPMKNVTGLCKMKNNTEEIINALVTRKIRIVFVDECKYTKTIRKL